MLVKGKVRDDRLGNGEDAAVMFSLSRNELETVVAVPILLVRILIPLGDVALGEGA